MINRKALLQILDQYYTFVMSVTPTKSNNGRAVPDQVSIKDPFGQPVITGRKPCLGSCRVCGLIVDKPPEFTHTLRRKQWINKCTSCQDYPDCKFFRD